jgi:cobalt-zinc-cadmium efflux system protein
MAHDHSHAGEDLSDRRLIIAIALNLLLTLFEAVAGLLAGSLALLADALHNFNDCASLIIALIARRIARKPSDRKRTFGYRRAEIIGALINLTVLVVVGLYLVFEAVARLLEPTQIDGWMVVGAAGVALVIDVATAALLFAMSRANLNLRAAFLHNVSDALASVGVIFAGAMILWFGIYWFDAAITLVIAAFILWTSLSMIGRSIHILMESAPSDVDPDVLTSELEALSGVVEIHHLHLWELDEQHRALEAHVVVDAAHLHRWTEIKQEIKSCLSKRFQIHHSTLESESPGEEACAPCRPNGQHC